MVDLVKCKIAVYYVDSFVDRYAMYPCVRMLRQPHIYIHEILSGSELISLL